MELAATDSGLASVRFDAGMDRLVLGVIGAVQEDRVQALRTTAQRVARVVGRSIELETVAPNMRPLKELMNYRVAARVLFESAAVQSLDLDESRGLVRIGVSRGADLDGLEARLMSIGIPADAVDFHIVNGFDPQILLTDKSRPTIAAGFKITSNVDMFNVQACTLGADIYNAGNYGFITNAHCSWLQAIGLVHGKAVYQNVPSNTVGVELIDPAKFTGGACPPSRICRYSDAMFVKYNSSSYYSGKKVAETTVIGTSGPGNLTVSKTYSVPTSSNLFAGLPVRKTGQTSGTTQGVVSQTCVDVASTSGILFLCQDIVSGYSRGGDSGSPVYWSFDYSGGSPEVYHSGILWGGDTTAVEYVLSPWYNISLELMVFY